MTTAFWVILIDDRNGGSEVEYAEQSAAEAAYAIGLEGVRRGDNFSVTCTAYNDLGDALSSKSEEKV